MMDQLCHYSEGKGKKREIVIKMEEESEGLEYASEDEYKTAPGTSEMVVMELIPIEQDLESSGILQEVRELWDPAGGEGVVWVWVGGSPHHHL